MGFVDFLTGKKSGSAAEIAAEIVELERCLPDMERAVSEAAEQSILLRQQWLEGVRVSSAALEKTEAVTRSAELALAAAQRGLGALQDKLVEAAKRELPAEYARIEKAISRVAKAVAVLKKELISEFAKTAIRWLEAGERLSAPNFFRREDCQNFADAHEKLLGDRVKAPAKEDLGAAALKLELRRTHLGNITAEKFADEILDAARSATADTVKAEAAQ